ncbi:hypothetical protein MHTCC0001_35640 [Flavobacteriaceae bacterium MHTCC 0001]
MNCYLKAKFLFVAAYFLLYISYSQEFQNVKIAAGFHNVSKNNGVAVADYDADNDLDIFIVSLEPQEDGIASTQSRLYRNENNGRFTDVTIESGLANQFSLEESKGIIELFGLDGHKFGAYWGDIDNDGFPDLFLTHLRKVQLYHNNGNGTFTDITNISGITVDFSCNITGATWVDYNNDGFLDIFLADWDGCNGNLLFKNLGNQSFQNVTDSSKINQGASLSSYTMLPFDFNDDGFIDFYISNDFKESNSLLINQSGETFIEAAESFGVDSMLDDMGITVGDINNDGFFDLFTTGIDENSMFLNNGNNTFNEVSTQFGLFDTDWSWGCTFADFDLDGDEDLFVTNGFYITGTQRNFYYKNLLKEGENGFEDISSQLNLDDLVISVEPLDFDYDNDGDLDLFITNSNQSSFFYENNINNIDEPNTKNWIQIYLEGTISNKNAIGAKVKITTENGSFYRYHSGVGFLSQSVKPIHFGLNNDNSINEIEVIWPSGLVETYNDVMINNFIKLTEGEDLIILPVEPSVKIVGCTNPNACDYNPLATSSNNNCAFLSKKEILGNINSGFNNIENYTYSSDSSITVKWNVSGGEIIDGQGSNSIQVKWGLNSIGSITAIEIGEVCEGTPSTLDVSLNINNSSSNISIARVWNEALLAAIRKDFARPTVHARNLFHVAIALYDVWAIFNIPDIPYLTGNELNGFKSELKPLNRINPSNIDLAQKQAMSFAAYRLLKHRFKNSPNSEETLALFDDIMEQLGYDVNNTDTDYLQGNAYAIGNYVAEQIINYGKIDGSREETLYDNAFYEPINPPLILNILEESDKLNDPNRWQPLTFETFRDQSGNLIEDDTPQFLSPEWGTVFPFSLKENDATTINRDGNPYKVYYNPGAPPLLDLNQKTLGSELYQWNFSLVSIWGSHLDPNDGIMWDISPGNIGNIDLSNYPNNFEDYKNFYKEFEGGDISKGRRINPKTNAPYESQIVPRGDYTRVLAEFWADGPDSETPPGHWFTILNKVGDHKEIDRRLNKEGDELSRLEWDIKSYFILAGAMHDAAITAWSIKGIHDYIRPISAIRYMASLGQSSNTQEPNYNIAGIPLKPDYIEVIKANDPLAGVNGEHIGKIKLFTWKGSTEISNPDEDFAGVGWILAEHWVPYQRASFVTPPFAGYVSGHSTFSRAAAEVLTLITGDEYFPGGLGEFIAKKNEFLVFEKGPSVDIKLQWATYRDASDQTSLSRIWGGIHPPADDILGRLIGAQIGKQAFNYALPYFKGSFPSLQENNTSPIIYPNPIYDNKFSVSNISNTDTVLLYDINGRNITTTRLSYDENMKKGVFSISKNIAKGLYIIKVMQYSSLIQIH